MADPEAAIAGKRHFATGCTYAFVIKKKSQKKTFGIFFPLQSYASSNIFFDGYYIG